jgi:hypothetical protein
VICAKSASAVWSKIKLSSHNSFITDHHMPIHKIKWGEERWSQSNPQATALKALFRSGTFDIENWTVGQLARAFPELNLTKYRESSVRGFCSQQTNIIRHDRGIEQQRRLSALSIGKEKKRKALARSGQVEEDQQEPVAVATPISGTTANTPTVQFARAVPVNDEARSSPSFSPIASNHSRTTKTASSSKKRKSPKSTMSSSARKKSALAVYPGKKMSDDGSDSGDDETPLDDAFGRINLVDSMGGEAHISDETVTWATIDGILTQCRMLQVPTVKCAFIQRNEHGESVKLVLCLSEFIAGFEPTRDVIASCLEEDGKHVLLAIRNPEVMRVSDELFIFLFHASLVKYKADCFLFSREDTGATEIHGQINFHI